MERDVIGVTPTDARFMAGAGHGVPADSVHRRTSPEPARAFGPR
jgi:hypothetical protein